MASHLQKRIEGRCVKSESEVVMPGMMKKPKVVPKRTPTRGSAKKKKPAMRRGRRGMSY